jgi:hypothetical protein
MEGGTAVDGSDLPVDLFRPLNRFDVGDVDGYGLIV